MDIKDFPLPQSIGEMRNLLEQFAPFLPHDKYQAVLGILDKLEKENGIQSDADGRALLAEVLNILSNDSNDEK